MHRALLLLLCLSCAPASPAPREPEREPPVAAPVVVAPRRQPVLLATNGDLEHCNPRGTTLTRKSVFVDATPPKGWKQCAGFVNTAEDDVTSDFLDNCLGSDRLRVRVYGPEGELEEDVTVSGIEVAPEWPSGSYLGKGGTYAKKTLWGGLDGGARSAFFVRTDGTDACGQPVTMRPSTTLGSGHAQTAIIAGGATGYDEYRVSCGQQALPERRIALYR